MSSNFQFIDEYKQEIIIDHDRINGIAVVTLEGGPYVEDHFIVIIYGDKEVWGATKGNSESIVSFLQMNGVNVAEKEWLNSITVPACSIMWERFPGSCSNLRLTIANQGKGYHLREKLIPLIALVILLGLILIIYFIV